MYKKINKTVLCDKCGKVSEDMVTIGLPGTSDFDQHYCMNCIVKMLKSTQYFKYEFIVHRIADVFQVPIKVEDLQWFPRKSDMATYLFALTNHTITEEYLVASINKYIGEQNYNLSTMLKNYIYLQLSRKNNRSFFVLSPDRYNQYESVRKILRSVTDIDYTKKISIVEYYKSIEIVDKIMRGEIQDEN